MYRFTTAARGLALSGLLLLAAAPALAEGKADRARTAIGEARGKVDTAAKLPPTGQVPRLQAEARSALSTAQEDLAAGRKEEAIAGAIRASEIADRAIGESQRNQDASSSARAADAAAAQQDAADANARAATAEQAAAAAQADAAAARAAPPVVVAAPAQPTTTVTTETTKTSSAAAAAPKRRVVRTTTGRPRTATTEKTTTSVTTTPQ